MTELTDGSTNGENRPEEPLPASVSRTWRTPKFAKEFLFHQYLDTGEMSRQTVETILGDEDVETAIENTEGAKRMFSGDPSRFLK